MIEVTNQPPLENYNLYTSDPILSDAVERENAGWASAELALLGERLGTAETISAGADANRHTPVLKAFDRYGRRIDEVEFHPSWHAVLGLALKSGLHAAPWAEPRAGAHVARAAGCYMLAQIESGAYCPVSMTYASVATLKHGPSIAAEWLPRIYSRDYDPSFRPAAQKSGALIGMAMTENQGGSDLRANVTRAELYRTVGERRFYKLTGHKWFMSAPMCDAFLVLAQTSAGPTCFLVPRWTPEGERNAIQIRRLKDKLGNRSNASSEVEFDGAHGELLGEEGARNSDHHRNGKLHAARLRHRFVGSDAAGAGAGDPSCAASPGVSEVPRRSAFDGERARRSRGRIRGGDGSDDAPCACLR